MKLRTNEDKINLPVKVVEMIESGGETGIKGINILTGEEVTAFLTTKGKSAEKKSRPTIESLFLGNDEDKGTPKLKAGGLVVMNGAFKLRGSYIAQWPYVIKYDDKDTSLLCKNGLLIPNERDDGSISADLYSFHPEKAITAQKEGAMLKKAVAKNAGETVRPAYLIRVVDDGKVLDYELHISVYNTDLNKPLTTKEIAESVNDKAGDLLKKFPGKTLNILPASRFFVPAQNYERRKKFYTGLNRHFIDDLESEDPDYRCRQTLITCGGDDNQYCNQVNVIEPFKPGKDPVLIGGYSYAKNQTIGAVETQLTGCRQ